jgi:hypothetical protein
MLVTVDLLLRLTIAPAGAIQRGASICLLKYTATGWHMPTYQGLWLDVSAGHVCQRARN